MLLTSFTIIIFSLTLIFATVAIFITLSTARLLRLQRAETYALQHAHSLNAEQLSRYLHIMSLTPSSLNDTQQLRKTPRMPPPDWMRKKAAQIQEDEDDPLATKELPAFKAS